MIATLFLIGSNLVPLVGIAFWGWDAFELLVLYWCETAVIGFWTAVEMTFRPAPFPDRNMERLSHKMGRGFRSMLLMVNVAIFMAAHMAFLWNLFAGPWKERIHGPEEFVRELIVGNGLWMPLAVTFVTQGALLLYDLLSPAGNTGAVSPFDTNIRSSSAIAGLYRRIVVMHLTILFGGWILIGFAREHAATILVAVKTVIDLILNRRREPARAAVPT
jgi:hypothetical protein